MEWAQQADTSLKSRAWNTKKITAHHAIIPTTVPCQLASLSETERNIYFLVSRAYIAQFYPDHIYEQTKIEIDQEEETFLAHGRIVKELGWKALYKRKKKDEVEEISELPLVKRATLCKRRIQPLMRNKQNHRADLLHLLFYRR